MKMNLIITGQIRNQESFDLLAALIAEQRHRFASVVFSSWSDQIASFKARYAGAPDVRDTFQFIDCGNAYFGPTISNRDTSSFLAQHQQIVRALHAVSPGHHLVRLRADFDPVGRAEFIAFIDLVEAIWSHPLGNRSSLVFGADDVAPYFFEDRILLLAPRHAEAIRTATFNALYEVDYFNLFPEFVLYSTAIGGDGDFLLHDHRYSRRTGLRDGFSAYDYATFGPEFSQFVQRYLNLIGDAVLFIEDGVALVGREELLQPLRETGFVLANFRIRDMREYRRTWASRADVYNEGLARSGQSGWDLAIRRLARADKTVFNAFFVMYFCGDTDRVISTPNESVLFDHPIRDLKGSSLLVAGRVDEGRDELNRLFNEGYIGFEQGFYLCRQLAADRDAERYGVVKAAFLSRFNDMPRAASHIAELDTVLAAPRVAERKPGKPGSPSRRSSRNENQPRGSRLPPLFVK